MSITWGFNTIVHDQKDLVNDLFSSLVSHTVHTVVEYSNIYKIHKIYREVGVILTLVTPLKI